MANDYPKVYLGEGVNGGDTLTVQSGGAIAVADGGSVTGTRIQRRLVSIITPSATALTTVVPDRSILSTELPLTIKSIRLLSEAAIAGGATSNATLNVKKLSALATATTSVATLTFTTTNAVAAYVPATIVLTSSVTVAAGESLVHSYTMASSGINVPAGQLTVEYVTDPT